MPSSPSLQAFLPLMIIINIIIIIPGTMKIHFHEVLASGPRTTNNSIIKSNRRTLYMSVLP